MCWYQAARSGMGFKANPIRPYSAAGAAGASGMSYAEYVGGMIEGIAGAPARLVVDGLNWNWREFGSDLVGTAGFAGGVGGLRGLPSFGATERLLGARAGGIEFGIDPVASGGPLRELSNGNVKITPKGINVVENHISRFGYDPANQLMIDRLRGISNGEISGSVADYNFYTHELREFTRVRSLGYESGLLPTDVYYNAHSAALREYGIRPKNYSQSLRALYHPDAIRLMEGQ